MSEKRYFTIEEAEKCLPIATKLIRKLQSLRERIELLLGSQQYLSQSVEILSEEGFHYYVSEQIHANKEFHHLYYQFYAALEKLDEIGVILKDLDEGLVDFYFQFEGRDVLLCWKLGERKIKYWHELDAGVQGRQPILDIEEFFKQKR